MVSHLKQIVNIFQPRRECRLHPSLEKVSESAIKEKQKFERLVVSKEKLLEMFNVRLLSYFLSHSSETSAIPVQQI